MLPTRRRSEADRRQSQAGGATQESSKPRTGAKPEVTDVQQQPQGSETPPSWSEAAQSVTAKPPTRPEGRFKNPAKRAGRQAKNPAERARREAQPAGRGQNRGQPTGAGSPAHGRSPPRIIINVSDPPVSPSKPKPKGKSHAAPAYPTRPKYGTTSPVTVNQDATRWRPSPPR